MNAITQALSAALLHFIWQGAIVGLLLWVALVAMRNRSANARYVASGAALALLAALPVITAAVLYVVALPIGVRTSPVDAISRTVVGSQQIFVPASSGGSLPPTAWVVQTQFWALPFWSAGVVIFSVRLLCGGAHVFVLGRRGEAADESTRDLVHRLVGRMRVGRPVRVLVSTLADAPSVIGWLRPVILLPPATAMGLTSGQLEAVLAHEVAHIRRHDYLVNILQMMVETLLFYHPVVWWTSKQIRVERELCCDDLAVASCGDVLTYARALTILEALRATNPSLAVGVTSGSLLYRIRRLLGASPRELAPLRWPGVLALCLGLACVAVNVNRVRAQTRPAFEVASVKPNNSGGSDFDDVFRPGGRYNAVNITVRQLIRSAYRLQGFQIVSEPSWITSDRFDIVAKSATELPPPRDPDTFFVGSLMLQTLLADRFKLAVHHETRELPVFALVKARRDGKVGPQLRSPEIDCRLWDRKTEVPAGFCGGIRTGPGRFTGKGATMRQLVLNLSPRVGRIVLDRTGLTGTFDLDLEWTPASPPVDPTTNAPAVSSDLGLSIFTALQEQLGLKLDSTTGPVDVLVVDHVERPTAD